LGSGWEASKLANLVVTEIAHVEVTVEAWEWPFAKSRRAEIDAHFADLKRQRTAIWNGRVLLLNSYAVENGLLSATAFETDYASLCAFRDWAFPDPRVFNFFAPAAIQTSDGAYVLGEMAPYTAGAGQITFPCGTPEPEDISARSVDLMGHMRREIIEETGLNPDEIKFDSGWRLVRDWNYLALLKRCLSSETADELCARIKSFLKSERRPEFSDVRIVRGRADFDPSMAKFTLAFLEHEYLHGQLSGVRTSGGMLLGHVRSW
jgi:8-oxo-dGTP pyrophosphatase MutT (NUDIX family)